MIPEYRARKINSDEWVEGYLVEHKILQIEENHIVFHSIFKHYEIDPNTLAIHFPNMIDKNGKKIFASLSEDGVGGDVVRINNVKYMPYNSCGDTMLSDANEDEIGNSLDLEYGEYHRNLLSDVREDIEVIGIYKGES